MFDEKQLLQWLCEIALNVQFFTHSPISRMEVYELALEVLKLNGISKDSPRTEVRDALRTCAKRLASRPTKRSVLSQNVDWFGAALGLDSAQKDLLAFAVVLQNEARLREIGGYLMCHERHAAQRGLAAVLRLSEGHLATALHGQGPLVGNRILWVEPDGETLTNLIGLADGVATTLFDRHADREGLMRSFLVPAPAPSVSHTDFPHLGRDVKLLMDYLAASLVQHVKGVNVLFYGLPGTGKTELARALGVVLEASTYQVRYASSSGEALKPRDRLASYQITQRYLAKAGGHLVVFDEIEDVFSSLSSERADGSMHTSKAWANDILESNPVPTIWISNDISQIDRAHLRRFDYSVHFGPLPASARRRIAFKYLGRRQSTLVDQLAAIESLLPSQISAAKKVMSVCDKSPAASANIANRTIQKSMQLLGLKTPRATRAVGGLNWSYFNTSVNAEALLSRLKTRSTRASLCFFGPPGTGKTALAQLIATRLERPLMIKKASDLLSPFVGETEQQIARAFEQARDEGAVLIFDEADGLLTTRLSALRAWEITHVNEMLTQIDSYDGILVCATNLFPRLDEAALRRFDVKVRFDYLALDQRCALFAEVTGCERSALEASYVEQLKGLTSLTPGDFAVARARSNLLGEKISPADLLEDLRAELSMKEGFPGRPIGFVRDKAVSAAAYAA